MAKNLRLVVRTRRGTEGEFEPARGLRGARERRARRDARRRGRRERRLRNERRRSAVEEIPQLTHAIVVLREDLTRIQNRRVFRCRPQTDAVRNIRVLRHPHNNLPALAGTKPLYRLFRGIFNCLCWKGTE